MIKYILFYFVIKSSRCNITQTKDYVFVFQNPKSGTLLSFLGVHKKIKKGQLKMVKLFFQF